MYLTRYAPPNANDMASFMSICRVMAKPTSYYIQKSQNEMKPKWELLDEIADRSTVNKAIKQFNEIESRSLNHKNN